MSKPRVSELTAGRLSLYLRILIGLEKSGTKTVSSGAMAEKLGTSSSQVRKDLACFGEFGVRGVGYQVPELREQIEHILGIDRPVNVAIIGAGNLGTALADYSGFEGGGFEVVALFDHDAEKVGTRTRRGIPIHDLGKLRSVLAEESIELALVAVPAAAAQEVADSLVEAGIRAILNFAPYRPRVPEGVRCRNVDVKTELECLSFFLAGRGLSDLPSEGGGAGPS